MRTMPSWRLTLPRKQFTRNLKNSVGDAINKLLAPIIAKFDTDEMRGLTEKAYSTKKEVKVKCTQNRKNNKFLY